MSDGAVRLTVAKETALSASLQALADSEVVVEKSRQRLCSLKQFSPQAAFSSLTGSGDSGGLGLTALHLWRSRQPSTGSQVVSMQAEFTELLGPVCKGSLQEMTQDDFMQLVLPRDDPPLQKEMLERGPGAPWQYDATSGRMPPDVGFQLSALLDAEVTFRRQLRCQRNALHHRGVSPRSACKALQDPTTLQRCIGASQCDSLARTFSEAPEDVAATGSWSLEALEWLLLERQEAPSDSKSNSPCAFPAFVGSVDFARKSLDSMSKPSIESKQKSIGNSRNPATAIAVFTRSGQTIASDATIQNSCRAPATGGARHSLDGSKPAGQSESGLSLRAALVIFLQQGEMDGEVEAARLKLPPGLPQRLEAVFNTLDRFSRGFLTETDLWQLMQDLPGSLVQFGHICALVRQTQQLAHVLECNELPSIGARTIAADGGFGFGASLDSDLQSGRPVDSAMPGRLSLRDFAHLVLLSSGPERRALRDAKSDADARSLLYILRDSAPCPGCGVSTQRDGDARDCPHVICPICGIISECMVLPAEILPEGDPHVEDSLRGLRSFFATAASKAQECLHAEQPMLDAMCTGSEVHETRASIESFKRHGSKFRYATQTQLRGMLKQQGLPVPSEQVLQFAWRRLRLFGAQYGQSDKPS